jgi:hypothetical protein
MNVNWWLVALSFVLGLVLTLAFMVRRVKREVPVYAGAGGATAATLTGAAPKAKRVAAEPDADADLPTGKIAAGGAAAAAVAGTAAVRKRDTDDDAATSVIEVPDGDTPTGKLAAGAAGGTAAAGLLAAAGKGGSDTEVEAPYGDGSARLAAGAAPPSGWDIKGNEDSMLYHTTDSPSYKQTIAEVWFRDEVTARAAGFTHWKEGRKATAAAKFAAAEPELPPGPHGPGSAKPAADGSGPEGWTVKGNEDSMLYHSTESPSYAVTIAEVWFRDVPTAEAAGFNRWDSGKSQRGKK